MEIPGIYLMDHGDFYPGTLKTINDNFQFESINASKKLHLLSKEFEDVCSMMMANGIGIRITKTDGSIIILSGFTKDALVNIEKFIFENCKIKINSINKCLDGKNEGILHVSDKNTIMNISSASSNAQIFDISMDCVSNVTTGFQFHQTEKLPVSLVEMRFYIDPNSNPNRNTDILTRELGDKLIKKADIINNTGDMLTEFPEINCLVPRGKYNVKLFDSHFQLYGKSYDFKIAYRSIVRLILVPHDDKKFYYFVMHIDPPLRQGQTRHAYVVFHLDSNLKQCLTLNKNEKSNNNIIDKLVLSLQNKCQVDSLCVTGKYYDIFPIIISELSNKKLILPFNYKSFKHSFSFICSHKTTTGLLYPLEKGFLYLHKPTLFIRNEEISGITFQRGTDSSRTFDLEFSLKSGLFILFSSIEKDEYPAFYDHIVSKNIVIRNSTVTKMTKTINIDNIDNDENMINISEIGDSSESNDEDFNPNKSVSGSRSTTDTEDGGFSQSNEDEEYVSNDN